MTNKPEQAEGLNELDELTKELAQKLQTVMVEFAAMVSEKLGAKFNAGILPFLRDVGNGSFRPDARVAILPVKETTNEGTDSKDGGEGQESSGGEEPTTSSVTTG
jgi:hypothetical protein